MEFKRFKYRVLVEIAFTRDELELISNSCMSHYDAVVRSAAERGGFVFGWLNVMNFGKPVRTSLDVAKFVCSSDQIDTCVKALEITRPNLSLMIGDLLRAMNAEYDKVNKRG